jgi:hypothetical protein
MSRRRVVGIVVFVIFLVVTFVALTSIGKMIRDGEVIRALFFCSLVLPSFYGSIGLFRCWPYAHFFSIATLLVTAVGIQNFVIAIFLICCAGLAGDDFFAQATGPASQPK